MKNIKENITTMVSFISVLTVFIGALFGIHSYVGNLINSKINSPEVIEELSLKLRPFLMFNTDNQILYNKGAFDEYIKNISFEDVKNGIPKNIIIETKIHLQIAPMLECLTYNCYAEPKRDKENRWNYQLISKSYLELEDSEHIKDHVFRLEIIK